MENEETKIEERKGRLVGWLKNPYNSALVILLIFTIAIKIYYFSMAANQPTWWDEGDYLGLGRILAHPFPENPEWWDGFVQNRPLLMPLVFSVFIRLAISEPVMRLLTEVLPSICLVFFVYLLGKSLFNRRVGLVAGFLTSIYWVIQFYGLRLMTDIPAMLLAVASAYFIYEYYVVRDKPYGLYLGVFLGVLSCLARFPDALVTISVLAFLLLIKRINFFKDKTIYIGGIVGVLSLSPYFLYMKISSGTWFPALATYGSANPVTYNTFAWMLFGYIPEFVGWPLTLFILLGLVSSLFVAIMGFDIFIKSKEMSPNNKHYFLLSWLLFQVVYYVFIIKTGNDRWILLWMPPLFIYAGYGLDIGMGFLKKYSKYLGVILVIVILGLVARNQMTHADSLIRLKLDSYKDVRDTGLWIQGNTPENSKIMAASVVQNTYYSGRRTYDFYLGNELMVWNYNYIDPQGRQVGRTNTILRNETELECKMVRIKPDYMILHVWEPEFTPDFMYSYPDRHPDILKPVKAFQTNGQTTAVIYKFISYPIINESLVNCTQVYERHENLTGLPLSVVKPSRLIIPS